MCSIYNRTNKYYTSNINMPSVSYEKLKPHIQNYLHKNPEKRSRTNADYYMNHKTEIFAKFYAKSKAKTRYNKEAKALRNILINLYG